MMAGRKRKQVDRQPNGQPRRSRPKQREDMTEVVKQARARVMNMPAAEAAQMPETSVLGKLRQMGAQFERLAKRGNVASPFQGITQQQYEAATEFQSVVMQRRRMIGAKGVPSGGDLERQPGHDSSDGTEDHYVREYRASLRRYNAAYAALNEANRVDPLCRSTVEAVCLADWDVPKNIGALRLGLNGLAQALGIGRRGVDRSGGFGQPAQLMDIGN